VNTTTIRNVRLGGESVVWAAQGCIPMVEEMATETWLCVRSILHCT
jgi:hypothetical protein